MRRVGVVTVGRSDFGIYLPLLQAMRASPRFDPRLLVSGAHLSPRFGNTIEEIQRLGFPVEARVEMLLASDSPEAIGKSMGVGLIGFTDAYRRASLDLLVVLGDRFEMHAAATAAVPLRIPIAHLHGGEVTEGAIDESWRHSITKLSHLHFVATKEYRRRVIQLGEEPWRVVVSGAPALDRVAGMPTWDRGQWEQRFGFSLQDPTLLATFHPVTQEPAETRGQMGNLLEALTRVNCQVVFTYPNADAGSGLIIEMLHSFQQRRDNVQVVDNLGPRGYFSLMRLASAMVGNSSSGIIEAASFGLPVVNIGTRQQGRIRARNVRDVGYEVDEIEAAVREAVSPSRKQDLRGMENPYGDGRAAERILEVLGGTPLDPRLLTKRFHDLPGPTASIAETASFVGVGINQ